MDILNFRSDTQTLPTEEMLEAMRNAELGDDVFGEDPTVNRLQEMSARMLGKQAALLVISGTMGNLVSLMTHASGLGGEVIVDPEAHVFYYEGGGLCSIAGWTPMPVASHAGLLDPDEVAAAIREPNIHYPSPRLLCLENTHNRSGGRVTPLDLHRKLCAVAKEHGLAVHLDGARIFNAAIAAGVAASDYAADADSVLFCLSKGLSCPLGSVIVGDGEFIERARYHRKRIGGGMRQAGIIAAAGIVALEKMIDRLADDHANAKLLARGVSEIPGLAVDVPSVETNMVNIDHTGTSLSTDEVVDKLKAAGVLVSGRPPKAIRMVTSRHTGKAEVEEATVRVRRALTWT
jgi:threonine aldolase